MFGIFLRQRDLIRWSHPQITGSSVCVQQLVCGLLLDSPFSFEGGLWYIGYRYHLLSWSHPHDGAVVALSGIHLIQTGEGPPGKRELHSDTEREREDTVEDKAVCQNALLFVYMAATSRISTPPVAQFATDFPDVLERVRMGAKALQTGNA